jgi:hypothetical protein
VKKLGTAALGIGLAMTLAGCGGGGDSPAAAVIAPTTTAAPKPKAEMLAYGDKLCDAQATAFGDLRRAAADLAATDPSDEVAMDFLVNRAVPVWEATVGKFRVIGVPTRDVQIYARMNKTLGEALTRMRKEAQNEPVDALKDLAEGPDKPAHPATSAGQEFANGNAVTTEFGFQDCEIF